MLSMIYLKGFFDSGRMTAIFENGKNRSNHSINLAEKICILTTHREFGGEFAVGGRRIQDDNFKCIVSFQFPKRNLVGWLRV